MKRTITKLLSLSLVLFMLMTTAPVMNTATAGGGVEYNLTVTPGCGFNMLKWDTIPGAAHYWIYRGPGPGQEFSTPLTDFPIKETEFKDTINIQNGQLYCYFVKAVDADAVEFDRTTEACATPNCYEEDECVLVLKYQQDNVKYWVNDVEQEPMETPPVNVNNRLFLVVRYVTQEIAGTTLDWEGDTKTVIITTRDGKVIKLQIGNKDAVIDGQTVQIDPNNPGVVPFIAMERTLLPMRFVAENLGATGPNDIKWFGDTRIVELRFDDPECDECDWVTGEIINTIYNSGVPTTVTATVVPHWEIEFMACDGTLHLLYSHEDMADPNGVNPLSEYRGCAEICIFDGVITKWKSRVDLEPCCPNRIPVMPICRKIEGEIMYTLYNEGEGLWEIKFKKCDNTFITVWSENDTHSGSFPLSQYRGCAEICIANELIKSWTAYPDMDNCCEELDCRKIKGEIMYTIAHPDTSNWEIKFKKCDDTYLTLWADSDIWSGRYPISQYKGCAEVCINDGVIISWTAYPDMDDCCEETEETCICIEIIRINCDASQPFLLAKIDGGDKVVRIPFDAKTCKEMKAAKAEGTCWEVCGEIKYLDTGEMTIEPTSFKMVKCPCGEEPEIPCICVTITDPTTSGVYAEDADGNTWFLTFEDSSNLGRMRSGECWKVCGTIQPPPVTHMETTKRMTVSSMEKVECPCDARVKEVCMCFTVERVACSSQPPKVYGYDENGNRWVLYMDDADECQKMEIGSCWKLCANYYGESEGNFRVLKEVNAEPTTCPCVPDNEICICVEIVRTACGGEVPLVYAKDKDGKMWVLLLENDDYCGMMQIGTCWSVCGNPAGLQGNIKTIKVTWQEKVDCPCGEEPEEECFCVVVEDPACHGNAPMVYVKDKNGDRIVLYMKDSYDCEQMKQGECWEVCGEWMTAVTGQKAFKVTSKKKVRCPCGEEKPECDEIVKGIVKYLGCSENDQIELEVDGQLILYRSKDARVCAGFEIGDCVEACIMNVAGATPVIIYMKKLDPKECESGDCVRILKGEIVDIVCTAYGYLKLKTPLGIQELTIRDIDVCEDFEIGDCVMVCLIKDPHNDDKLIIDWMDTISDDQCPSDEKEICICATIIKSYCGLDRPYVLVKDEKGNRWIVYLENGYDCEKMKPGSCWTICGRPIEGKDSFKGIKITYFEKVDCPCLSEEITLCVTVQDPACGGNIPKVYVLLPNGKQIVLYFDGKDECNRMKPEECWEIHGSWFFDETTGVVGFKVASMEKTDCPCGKPEPNDEFDMIIYGTSCDLRMPYYTAVFKGHLYNVYLPSNFDCKKFKVYDCIKVKGKLDKKNITAVSIVKRECAIRGLYGCTVVSTNCIDGYMEVKYGTITYKFYYPPYFDCSSIQPGDCLTFRGNIYTSGVIKEVSIVKKTPCR